jgi:hypothetical protein
LVHALLLAVAFTASDTAQWDYVSVLRVVGNLIDNLSCLLALVIVLTAIQTLMKASAARLAVMIAAVVAIGIAIPEPRLLAFLRHAAGLEEPIPDMDLQAVYLYLAWGAIASGTLLAIFYEWQARADRIAEATRTARLAGEHIERKILDARLNSIKAKVDPKLLFAVVERAQALYGRSAHAAESLLEALIEFLRASLPRSQSLSVTLEQEATLCRRYLDLERAMRDGCLSYEVRVDPTITGRYFPPAVLLLLVQALVTSAAAESALHISIAANCLPDRLRIDLASDAGAVSLPDEALHAGSSALRGFFGEGVSISATATPSYRSLVRIDVPLASMSARPLPSPGGVAA